jgi:predicted DNA-binding protein (MmcQ/YjbR family)
MNIDHRTVETYILSLPGSFLDYPFGQDVAVYKVGEPKTAKMFALIREAKQPIQISLKCDPALSKVLRESYDEVMPGDHLNKKHWNTIVMTGQLSWEDIQGLIRHSYDLVGRNLGLLEQ